MMANGKREVDEMVRFEVKLPRRIVNEIKIQAQINESTVAQHIAVALRYYWWVHSPEETDDRKIGRMLREYEE